MDVLAAVPGQVPTRDQACIAIEVLTKRFLQGLASVSDLSTVSITFSEPCTFAITEDGSFKSSSNRKRRIEFKALHYRRFARLFGALDAVHRLRDRRRKATQRELFYRAVAEAPSLFRKQAHMDAALLDVVGTLEIGRPHLGVFATEKGLVAGAIRFGGQFAGCAASGVAISEALLSNSIDAGEAHCVLVLEKDSFFQHLLHGRLLATLPLVLITGRGYPDLLTRRLLQCLSRTWPQVPQVYFGDHDPHGVSIFLTYRASCPFLRWLGMHAVDVQDLPSSASLPLTKHDCALKKSLLRHPMVLQTEAFTDEILMMDRKFELEALIAAHGEEGVARHYVPKKILGRAWLGV